MPTNILLVIENLAVHIISQKKGASEREFHRILYTKIYIKCTRNCKPNGDLMWHLLFTTGWLHSRDWHNGLSALCTKTCGGGGVGGKNETKVVESSKYINALYKKNIRYKIKFKNKLS